MKKKGLLISTIVMMLVVVVALSTATYAWFSVSADAKISTLTVQTAASDGLEIASYYGGLASHGEMTLSTDAAKTWTNTNPEYDGFGAELIFATALASAYGVTGNGLKANMYTAASRSATAYATTAVDQVWWDANGPDYVEEYGQFYRNVTGMTLATTTGDAVFTDGAWTGDITLAEQNIVGQGYYVRTQGYDTIRIDASNVAAYAAVPTMVYYKDGAGIDFATGDFTAGVYTGADLATFVLGTPTYARKVHTIPTGTMTVKGVSYYTDFELTLGVIVGGEEPVELSGTYYTIGLPHDVQIAWNYEANNSALNGTAPRYLIQANANVEYFSLNFILRTQRGMVGNSERLNIADIFLKKLSVTASGGMAAAARIAIYEYDSNEYIYNENTDLKYVYAPFSKSQFSTDWQLAAEAETLNYDVAPLKNNVQTAQHWDGNGFAYDKATHSAFSQRVINDNTLISSSNTWATANIFDIDKNVVWNDKALYLEAQEYLDVNMSRKINSIGAFTAANIQKYYQLVIWFEGTDAQCIGGYAGTGVTVDIAFDFFQRYTTGVTYSGFPVTDSTTGRVA